VSSTVALVTGGGRGVGQATALALAARGHAVVIAAQSQVELETTAKAIRRAGGRVEPVVADVSRADAVDRVFDEAHRLGPVALLVNNAATLERAPFAQVTIEAFDRTLAVNLRGAFLCARMAFKDMVTAGGGRIVNIASLSGIAGVEKFPGLSPYVISKFGMVGLTESLAVEGAPHGIRVIGLAPGAVETQLLQRALPGMRAGATADDIARLIVFLLSDAAAPLHAMTLPLYSNVT
jgi:NAD(P)-dependent dehydrogenase (short-subunit alcohol dehydrogenase family)